MLVLPNTPPIPRNVANIKLPSHIISSRLSVCKSATTYNELVRFVVAMEQYLELLADYCSKETGSGAPSQLVTFAKNYYIDESNPPEWTELLKPNLKNPLKKDLSKWTLLVEIQLAAISISLSYISLASQLIEELIELDQSNLETNEKWKNVTNLYKKGVSFIKFVNEFFATSNDEEFEIDKTILVFLEKFINICIQLSIVVKHSWINRQEFDKTESFSSSNNSTLARVSIFVMEELQDLISNCKQWDLSDFSKKIQLNYKQWKEYIDVAIKYARAYAGLFLGVEMYQQDKIGESIGLVNFSLLTLQKKNFDLSKEGKLQKLVWKVKSKRNESYIKKLQSTSTINVNDSVFSQSSAGFLKDLSYLFDQLISLRVKLNKENDNLKFDSIVDWAAIHTDSRWPMGCSINVTTIAPFQPKCIHLETHKTTQEKRAYY